MILDNFQRYKMPQINKTLIGSTDPKEIQHTSSLKESILENVNLGIYSSMNQAPLKQVFMYQTLGMIIFTYGLSCFPSNVQLEIPVTAALFVAIIIAAPMSGANFNPAITLSNCFRKESKYKWKLLPVYLTAQLLGATIALLLSQIINDISIGPLVPDDSFSECLRLILSEMVGTFFLVFFTLQISNPNTTFIENELSGYAFITIFVFIGRRFAFSPVSTINFCHTLAIGVLNATRGENDGFSYIWLWLLGDLLGFVLGTLFYDYLFEPNIKRIRHRRQLSQQKQYSSIRSSEPQQE